MQDWAGWLLFFSSFIFIISFKDVWKDRSVAFAMFLILVFHHLAAITNAYIVMLPGNDALGFWASAVALAEGEIITGNAVSTLPYTKFLSVVHTVFGSSYFFTEELSVITFAFSCIVFIKLINLTNVCQHRVGLLMLYGLLPATILFTSMGLREAYQILFLMLTVYFGLRIHVKPMIGARLLMTLSAVLFGLLHHAFIIIAVALVPMLLSWKPRKPSIKKRFAFLKRFLVSGMAVFIFLVGWYYCTGPSGLFKGYGVNINRSISSFKEQIERRPKVLESVHGRTNYYSPVDLSSIKSVVITTLRSLAFYLFGPFPWQIRASADIILGFEALIRFLLVVFSIRSWCKSQGSQRRLYGLFLVVWFLVVILFALGTANYGTAMRHNIVSHWLLVLVGGSGLIKFVTILPISKSEVHNSSREIKGY